MRYRSYVRMGIQAVSVAAVALGVGLLVGGNSIDSTIGGQNLEQAMRTWGMDNNDAEFLMSLAWGLYGAGAAFLTLGVLGLLVPWANVLVYGRQDVSEESIEVDLV